MMLENVLEEPTSKNSFLQNLEESDESISSRVSALTEYLYDDDVEKRNTALLRLSQIAQFYPDPVKPACGKVRNLARNDETKIQQQALKVLLYVGKNDPEEIRTIIGTAISMLYEENAKTRELAVIVLIISTRYYRQKVRPAIPRLIEMLDDSNELPRAPAAKALAELANQYPSDIKSEETIARLNQMTDVEVDPTQRGPEVTEKRVEYAEEALENLQKAIKEQDVELPESILDDELRLRVVEHFENEQYQSAVQQAFITLEERVRDKGNFSYEESGTSLMTQAFHYDNGHLAIGETEAERRGVMLLYKSAFQSFRNPSSHRFLEDMSAKRAHHIISFVDLLLEFME